MTVPDNHTPSTNADSGRVIRPDDGLGHYEDCGSRCPCYKHGWRDAMEQEHPPEVAPNGRPGAVDDV